MDWNRTGSRMAATFSPLWADRAEFSRMVPEKVEAFSTAGMVMLKRSGQASRQIMRFASDEVATAVRATIDMGGCRSPAALAGAQSRFARAWFARASLSWIAMGIQALRWRPFGRRSSPMLSGSVGDKATSPCQIFGGSESSPSTA
jgi:hypothetical protein